MKFTEQALFHVYNQGNNKQRIFFKDDDYLDFLERMKKHLLPHAELLAYCLMPNHFHFMVYVKNVFADFPMIRKMPDGTKTILRYSRRSFNFSIGLMLRSYADRINFERDRSGSLFRQKTKAKSLEDYNLITVDQPQFSGKNIYKLNCFYYIHDNPKEAKLVKDLKDWPFSSYLDYAGLRNDTFCNRELARKILGRDKFY